MPRGHRSPPLYNETRGARICVELCCPDPSETTAMGVGRRRPSHPATRAGSGSRGEGPAGARGPPSSSAHADTRQIFQDGRSPQPGSPKHRAQPGSGWLLGISWRGLTPTNPGWLSGVSHLRVRPFPPCSPGGTRIRRVFWRSWPPPQGATPTFGREKYTTHEDKRHLTGWGWVFPGTARSSPHRGAGPSMAIPSCSQSPTGVGAGSLGGQSSRTGAYWLSGPPASTWHRGPPPHPVVVPLPRTHLHQHKLPNQKSLQSLNWGN